MNKGCSHAWRCGSDNKRSYIRPPSIRWYCVIKRIVFVPYIVGLHSGKLLSVTIYIQVPVIKSASGKVRQVLKDWPQTGLLMTWSYDIHTNNWWYSLPWYYWWHSLMIYTLIIGGIHCYKCGHTHNTGRSSASDHVPSHPLSDHVPPCIP